jgi:hypothetical protein
MLIQTTLINKCGCDSRYSPIATQGGGSARYTHTTAVLPNAVAPGPRLPRAKRLSNARWEWLCQVRAVGQRVGLVVVVHVLECLPLLLHAIYATCKYNMLSLASGVLVLLC